MRYCGQSLSLGQLTAFSESGEGRGLGEPPAPGGGEGEGDAGGAGGDAGAPPQRGHRHQPHQPPVNVKVIGCLKTRQQVYLVHKLYPIDI